MRSLVAAAFLLAFCLPTPAQQAQKVDHVIVYKQQRKMVLLSKGTTLKTYEIAVGTEPVGAKSPTRSPHARGFLCPRFAQCA